MAWYCVYTNPRCEDLAARHLGQQHFATLLLTFLKTYRSHRKPVKHNLFPRYLFVEFDIHRDHWQSIFGTMGVHSLFMASHVPIAVPDSTMDRLRRLYVEDTHEERGPRAIKIEPGTKVRLLAGSFAYAEHNEAICTWSDDWRVRLLFAIMGREVEVMFDRSEVEPL